MTIKSNEYTLAILHRFQKSSREKWDARKEVRQIEEKILKLQEIKNKLLDDLISEDNLSTKNLSKSDIEFILGS